MIHECNKEREIEKISSQLDQLSKVIYGNGSFGLVSVTRGLSDRMGIIMTAVETIETDIKVLLRFQSQTETKEKEFEKHEKQVFQWKIERNINRRWRTGIVIASIISIIGLIIALMTLISKMK